MAIAFKRKYSQIDDSVNCIAATPDGGTIEARYVQRDPSYFIVYLSSHTGCAHTCRFCHLTATNQRMMTPMSIAEYLDQAREVMAIYREKIDAGMSAVERVHFNFMARGEPLSNPHLVTRSQELFDGLRALAANEGVSHVKFNVSSIYPNDGPDSLLAVLADPDSELYYSLYSLNPRFRRRWLPHAVHPLYAIERIAEYQAVTGRRTTLHWAFIENQNDQPDEVARIIEVVEAHQLNVKFNLVRYNPFDQRYGQEPSMEVLNEHFQALSTAFKSTESRIVPRVGPDVMASCGMFVSATARFS